MKDPKPMFGDAIGPWRPWFAWRPVETFDGVWVWLRVVGRRRIQKHDYLPGGADFWWQYAPISDLRAACQEQINRDAVCWVNEYQARDGRRYRSLPCESKREAVRVGAQEQGLHGSLVIFRWRVRARLPAAFGA